MIPKTFRNYSVFIDGRGYLGKTEKVEIPSLALKREKFRPGGFDGEISHNMGMEEIEVGIIMLEYNSDLLRLWGLSDEAGVGIEIRGAQKGQGSEYEPVILNLRGQMHNWSPDPFEAGVKNTNKFMLSATYFKLTVNGSVDIEIDIENIERRVGPVDQLAAMRTTLNI